MNICFVCIPVVPCRYQSSLAVTHRGARAQIPILMLGSALASVVAISITCPFMAVKTRLIADESFAGGSLVKGLRRIIDEEVMTVSILLYSDNDCAFVDREGMAVTG